MVNTVTPHWPAWHPGVGPTAGTITHEELQAARPHAGPHLAPDYFLTIHCN